MTHIIHASIPADDPHTVATTLARLLGGSALPFPPGGPQAWIAWADDDRTQIEVVPRGDCLTPGAVEAEWRATPLASRGNEVHLAIAVPLPAETVLAIAEEVGWTARRCNRGGLFELIELWVEDTFLLELLDPAQAARFEQSLSARQWAELLAAGPPEQVAA